MCEEFVVLVERHVSFSMKPGYTKFGNVAQWSCNLVAILLNDFLIESAVRFCVLNFYIDIFFYILLYVSF